MGQETAFWAAKAQSRVKIRDRSSGVAATVQAGLRARCRSA
jgi:hypothetical protein